MSLSVSQPLFPLIGHNIEQHIISYLDPAGLCQLSAVSKWAKELSEQRERTIFATIEIFDQKRWKDYYRVEITDEFNADKINRLVLRKFLIAYYGKNPIGEGRVCDNCLIPTVVPSKIRRGEQEEDYCLSLLGELAEHPLKGHPATYSYQSKALEQYGKRSAGPSSLVIQLKGVIARGKPWSKQEEDLDKLFHQTGWGCQVDALSQNTVVIAHQTKTGERPLGDDTGMEGRWTYGRTIELAQYGQEAYHMVSGGFRRAEGPVGGSAPAVLAVDFYFDFGDDGVVALRKFSMASQRQAAV